MPAINETIALAMDHHRAGRLKEAHDLYRQILAADPTNVSAWNLLGVAGFEFGNHQFSLQCLDRAFALEPNSAEVLYNRGLALQSLGRIDEAVASYRRALEIDPHRARAHNNIGKALKDQGQLPAAIDCIQQALALDPNLAEAHCNFGNVLQAQGHWDEARQYFERSIGLKPDYAPAHTNLAMVLLAIGDFEHAWPEYEWRWKTGQAPLRKFTKPQWDGRPLSGQTILLHAEQGIGDTLQFIRYAPLVKATEATVIAECPPPLTRLFATCPGIDQVIASGDQPPSFDFHTPLLSLPGLFKTTIATIPANVPYLSADPALVDLWRERLALLRGLKVGINWRGRPGVGSHRLRDIPLSLFAPLTALPITLVSLQHGATPEELAVAATQTPIFHPGDDFDRSRGAFMDTAAIMKNLDLVITSDTSLPHLGGALGVPVWVALPFVPGWQWLLDRPDSPWYPTARLFRQTSAGDWISVFSEIQSSLGGFEPRA